MPNPSIFFALNKLRSLLTRPEKIKWLWIAGFTLLISGFELLTAGIIVIFAQVLNEPETGLKYLRKFGINEQYSAGRVVFIFAVIVGIVYLIKNCFAAFEVYFQNFSIQKMCYEFKKKLLLRYADMDYAQYTMNNSSFYDTVIVETETMFANGMVSLATLLSESVIFCSLLIMIVIMNPAVALAILGLGTALSLVVSKMMLPQFYKFGQRLQQASLMSQQNLYQFFHGFKEIIILGKKKEFIESYQFYSKNKAQVLAVQKSVDTYPRLVIEVLFVGIFVVTISVLCYDHETPTHMMGILSAYLYVGFRLMPGLNRVLNMLNAFKATIPLIERVHKEYQSKNRIAHYQDCPNLIFNEEITFNNISFNYPNTEKVILKDISFSIKKGESIGIVGETGSGKSTFVDLLLGLLKPTSGDILVDNKYPVDSYQWHEKIGYVPQAIYLIDDTIRANISFGTTKCDEDLLDNAIKAAQLKKLIDSLPMGIDTIVGERGIRLSGGERQRISIARALYRNPEILIFDEATSALDQETEKQVMETINMIRKDRTVVMIAHRLSTLNECDQIVKIEQGKIC